MAPGALRPPSPLAVPSVTRAPSDLRGHRGQELKLRGDNPRGARQLCSRNRFILPLTLCLLSPRRGSAQAGSTVATSCARALEAGARWEERGF